MSYSAEIVLALIYVNSLSESTAELILSDISAMARAARYRLDTLADRPLQSSPQDQRTAHGPWEGADADPVARQRADLEHQQ